MFRINRIWVVETHRSPAAPGGGHPDLTCRRVLLAALLALLPAAAAGAHPTLCAAQPTDAALPAPTTESPAEGADRVTLGLDMVSRYVWRGQAFGDAPCLQPWAGVSFAGFNLGTWGSFPVTPVAGDPTAGTTEVDLSLARSLEFSAGTITATLADYHFPSSGISPLKFEGGGAGGHTIETCLAYRGPDRLPVGLCGSVNVYNDTEHAAYAETSYALTAGTTEVSFVAGAALGKSAWYAVETRGVHFINASVTAGKPLKITDSFAPNIKVSWVLNPDAKRVMLVAALSL